MNRKLKKRNLKEIQKEIVWYNAPKRIASAMITLGKMGFQFSGHGWGVGVEDFGLVFQDKNRFIYVTLTLPVKHSSVCPSDNNVDLTYTKSIPNTIRLVKKLLQKSTKCLTCNGRGDIGGHHSMKQCKKCKGTGKTNV